MTSIDEAFTDRRGLLLYAGATAFVAGVFLVGIGSLSITYDAIESAATPATAVLWAPTVAGLGLAACLLGATVLVGGRPVGRLTVGGVATSGLGVGLVWAVAPGAPPGTVTASLLAPVVVYVLGTLALLAGLFSAALEPSRGGSRPAVQPASTTGGSVTDATVADGGDEDAHLTFLLDRDDEDDGPDRL